jgi:class 3 adenylate cyclase
MASAVEEASEREQHQRARLANIRQELLAPVSAIAGYAEILREEAGQLGLDAMIPDLDRVMEAAGILRVLVEGLLDATSAGEAADAAVEQRLRHDLRNPLNAINGYGELLLEDLDGSGDSAPLRHDLERLLAESDRLLANLDLIVDLSRGEAVEPAGDDQTGSMLTELLRTIRPGGGHDETIRSGGNGRILVVDDNASNRELLLRRLAHEGHRGVEADSGRRALQLLAAEAVDLILLDLMMPEMNGLQVLEQLKADPRLREIPVIMISGLRESEGVIRCIEAGAEDYLPKPFDPILLRARINACLERKRWSDRERHYLARLEEEKERYEALLHNILPGQIVCRLNGGEAVIADRIPAATILFCDLVGFTGVAARVTPARLVDGLNRIFSEFDALTRSLGAEKIKTIGDAYMAAAGLPEARTDHAEVMAELALDMLVALEKLGSGMAEARFTARIGLHTGPVVAGIIGTHRSIYDVWGDTVNVASRLETHGVPGRIHVSDQVRRALDHGYEFEARGAVALRGKGRMRTSFLTGRKRDAVGVTTPRTPP